MVSQVLVVCLLLVPVHADAKPSETALGGEAGRRSRRSAGVLLEFHEHASHAVQHKKLHIIVSLHDLRNKYSHLT